jgi:hypothetical protein
MIIPFFFKGAATSGHSRRARRHPEADRAHFRVVLQTDLRAAFDFFARESAALYRTWAERVSWHVHR